MAGSRLLTKILADFLFSFYLLIRCLNTPLIIYKNVSFHYSEKMEISRINRIIENI